MAHAAAGKPVAAPASALHVLDRRDVQRICSGQSVVDLATAVKELVENALDAGASQIEVKLKEFGRDAFEVSDNGAGVTRENYASLAKKHYTSKISSFEDIETVASFGFRGEALSSICELAASFSVCTRTQNEAVGALLEYDTSGQLVKETKKARPVGTTVSVEELFKPLAVRHKDFQRNIKKHYAKLLKVLQAYAVSCANVKICVFNITGKNANRHVVLATQAHQTMGENIANVFGTKFFRTMLRVDFELRGTLKVETGDKGGDSADDSDSEQKSSAMEEDNSSGQTRTVEGFVSKVGAGVGRSDNDRQFFFINGRPFDLPKLAKTLNEVWRQYEMKQKPACVLNFHLPLGEYDVNVTPDKRETFVKHEAEIIDAFKTGLNKLYEPSRGTFTVQPLMTAFARTTKTEESNNKSPSVTPKTDTSEQPKPQMERAPAVETRAEDESEEEVTLIATPNESSQANRAEPEPPKHVIVEVLQPQVQRDRNAGRAPDKHKQSEKQKTALSPKTSPASPPSSPEPVVLDLRKAAKRQKLYSPLPTESTPSALEENVWSFDEMVKQRQQYFEEEVEYERKRKTNHLKVPKTCSTSVDGAIEADNEVAAAALQRVLKKEDFKRMEVLGQFNLGFIIGKLDNDLFIIDQHASDEKFNYETLQQTTVMHQQPLVRPLMLELTAGEEMVILDHLNVFAKNGFTFLVDKDAPATKKLKLLSLPFTKHTQFGTEDIRELASLLMDAPLNPATVRLPKVMAMFASRACRSSIMIGTALHKEEMQKIVRNLSGLDQPWNCPHGRPTLRHLVDLMHLEGSN
ncbi:putative mismatch repair endonuclease pms1 [Phytophthora cinnamomi]|uniref:putative mismatch repair endonuclease pms1 n=1 Tax=Phytophthora cinnamomi TaxID=4785 RepID=UPI00355A9BDB|nr:putative mismatch repair endonuclease pms1 [Phytophthora cinnamomi]